MRDREFINRFCAFQLFDVNDYRGDMDDFLAQCLHRMNKMEDVALEELSRDFHRGLSNNFLVFGRHAFRKHELGQEKRGVLNASLWDVMSTGLSGYEEKVVKEREDILRQSVHRLLKDEAPETLHRLLKDEEFVNSISSGTNDSKNVKTRFDKSRTTLWEVLGDHVDQSTTFQVL